MYAEKKLKSVDYTVLRKFHSLILHCFSWGAKIRRAFMENFRKARCSKCRECNADVAFHVKTELHNLIWTVERFRALTPNPSIKRRKVDHSATFFLVLFTVYSLDRTR